MQNNPIFVSSIIDYSGKCSAGNLQKTISDHTVGENSTLENIDKAVVSLKLTMKNSIKKQVVKMKAQNL